MTAVGAERLVDGRGRRLGEPVALAVLLVGTAVLYLWGVTANGWANTFYSGAGWAGSVDWTAWFFASVDPSNFITVDKPPAAMWVMGLSVRLFGVSPASMLVPQALMGVGTVALVYAAVRRVAAAPAALIAGTVVALTPAAANMFRYNNTDALLALLMTAGAYCVVRAIQTDVGRRALLWMALSGIALGFAFLTKMVQGWLVLPGLALAYLLAGQPRLRTRLLHVAGAGAAVLVSAGWWVVAATFWPAGSRPYIGGSTDGTVMNLIIEGNGLGRLLGHDGTGHGAPSGGPGGFDAAPGSLFGGPAGLERLFGDDMGNEVSWLIPSALIALACGLVARGRAPRTDPLRASLVLWGGWFVVTALAFSYAPMAHPYYSVALAPAIGAIIGVGGYALWQCRDTVSARGALSAMVLAAGVTSWIMLHRNATWHPELRWVIIVGALIAVVLVATCTAQRTRGYLAAAVTLAAVAGVTGSGSYAVATASYPQSGPLPSAGPQGAVTKPAMFGGPPSPGSQRSGGPPGLNFGTVPTDPGLVALLRDAGPSRWAAVTNGASLAARMELDARVPVMAIGGFGQDPAPTLEQFIGYATRGDVRYYVADGPAHVDHPGTGTQIRQWVSAHYDPLVVGPDTVYDLSRHVHP